MDETLSRYLSLIRRTCAEAAEALPPGDPKTKLGQIGIVLDKLVFETTVLPKVHAAHAPDFAKLLPGQSGASFADARAGVSAKLARQGLEGGGPALARAAVDADGAYEAARKDARKAFQAAPMKAPTIEETFNAEGFVKFVAEAVPGEGNVRVTDARVASRGFSKKTMLVSLEGNTVLPKDLALRIDQNTEYLGTTVLDEFDALRLVCKHGARAPNPIALEATGKVLGNPFIMFPRVSGAPAGGVYNQPPRNEALSADAAGCLATIHKTPVDGLKGLGASRKFDRPYIDHDIESHYAKWQSYKVAHPTLEAAFAWIRAHRADADGQRRTVVHNDFTYNNLLVEDGRLTAVLDWEFVHLGNPASDLGYHYYAAEGVSSFEHFLGAYEKAGGIVPSRKELDFYILWGQIRLLVMMYGMPWVFETGRSDDIRFAIAMPMMYDEAMRRVMTKLDELLGK